MAEHLLSAHCLLTILSHLMFVTPQYDIVARIKALESLVTDPKSSW